MMVDLDSESLAEAERVVGETVGSNSGAAPSVDYVAQDAVTYLQEQAEAGRLADVDYRAGVG